MASPFKQEQGGKVKFEGPREKLPGLFPGWPPSDLCGTSLSRLYGVGVTGCKGVWEMLPQQN